MPLRPLPVYALESPFQPPGWGRGGSYEGIRQIKTRGLRAALSVEGLGQGARSQVGRMCELVMLDPKPWKQTGRNYSGAVAFA